MLAQVMGLAIVMQDRERGKITIAILGWWLLDIQHHEKATSRRNKLSPNIEMHRCLTNLSQEIFPGFFKLEHCYNHLHIKEVSRGTFWCIGEIHEALV